MRDLITADLHLSDNPRDEYRFQFLEQRLPKLIRQFAVERVYLLGDLTEQKDYHSAKLVNRIIDALVVIAEHCHIVLLRGNHDYEADINTPFFGFIHYIDKLSYVNEPMLSQDWDLLLPHSRNPAEDWKTLPLKGAKMILAHATFTGALGSNQVPLAGAPPPSTSIPIVSGDVHVPQKLGNITYVGAPYSINFGDDYRPRLLLRQGVTLTTVKLKGPRKLILRDWPDKSHDAQPGDIVRIQVKLARKDYDRWPEQRELARQWGVDAGLVVDSVVPLVDTAEIIASAQRNSHGVLSDEQVLSDYCDKFQIDKAVAKEGEELL